MIREDVVSEQSKRMSVDNQGGNGRGKARERERENMRREANQETKRREVLMSHTIFF